MSSSPSLGVTNGKLQPCPDKPNCVSTQSASKYPQAAPIPLGAHSGADAIAKIAGIIGGMERSTIITQSDTYLHAEFRSKLFKFVDDIEFFVDGNEIHFRSAARSGYGDMNANPKRTESIRMAFGK